MLNAARAPFPFSSSNIARLTRQASGIRFASGAKQTDSSAKMDPKKGDSNMQSFGEGYASRSDEDGFGGTQQNQQQGFKHDAEDKSVHGKETEFDHAQGCEVKEKEDARNQKK